MSTAMGLTSPQLTSTASTTKHNLVSPNQQLKHLLFIMDTVTTVSPLNFLPRPSTITPSSRPAFDLRQALRLGGWGRWAQPLACLFPFYLLPSLSTFSTTSQSTQDPNITDFASIPSHFLSSLNASRFPNAVSCLALSIRSFQTLILC